MNETSRYDVIIIGTGAGGGTLAHRLAPSGKRILLLERGDYVPREKDNWSTRAVNLEGKYNTKEVWRDRGRRAAPSPHELLGRGQHQVLRGRALPAAPGGLRGAQALGRDLARVAHSLRGSGALLHAGRAALPRARSAGGGPDRPARPARRTPTRRSATSLACSSSATTSQRLGLRPFHVPLGVLLDEQNPRKSRCIRCGTCDGHPCLVYAKADAQVLCVDPALEHPNVTLLTGAYVSRLETSPSGREVTRVIVERQGGHGEPTRPTWSSCRAEPSTRRRCCSGRPATSIRAGWPTARTSSAATTWVTSTRC